MGLLDSLFGNNDASEKNTQMVRNLLTKEIESNYTNKMTTTEFNDIVSSLADGMKVMLNGMDKKLIQELTNTLSSISKEDYDELFELSLALCRSRLLVLHKNAEYSHLVEKDILGTANSLLNVIHHEIKNITELLI